ncbi:MAG: Ig-like domain-containing protein [Lachnospiraceae bacterium]|nr:Ig-like domain-containing protein [Lachnospiraceae bacterium]
MGKKPEDEISIIDLDDTGALPLLVPVEEEETELPEEEYPEEAELPEEEYPEEEIPQEAEYEAPPVFQGEVSVDTTLLTDIREELKFDMAETRVMPGGGEIDAALEEAAEIPEKKGLTDTDMMPDTEAIILAGIEAGMQLEDAPAAGDTIVVPDIPEDPEYIEGEYPDGGYAEEEYGGEEFPEEEYAEDYPEEEAAGEELPPEDEEEYPEENDGDEPEEEYPDEEYDEEDDPEEEYDEDEYDEEDTPEEEYPEDEQEPEEAPVKKVPKGKASKNKSAKDKAPKGKKSKEKNTKEKKPEEKPSEEKASAKKKSGRKGPIGREDFVDLNAPRVKAPRDKNRRNPVKERERNTAARIVGVAALFLIFGACALYFAIAFRKAGSSVDMKGLGQEISSIGIAGQQGLIAMAAAEETAVEEPDPTEGETEEPEPEPEEEEADIRVEMVFTSIEQDLKIKFTDDSTGHLISGVEFKVKVTPSKSSAITLTDSDKDGIIHEQNMKGGSYAVEAEPIEGYVFVNDDSVVSVRDKIVYQQVAIKEEIKTEAEVNAAVEDTAGNNEQAEEPAAPTTKDTVEFVESSKTAKNGEDAYKKIEKSSIAEPAYAALPEVVERGAQEDAIPTPIPTAEPTPIPTAEPTATPTPEATPTEAAQEDATPTPTPADQENPEATATPTPIPEATSTPTPTEKDKDKAKIKKVELETAEFTLAKGEKRQLKVRAVFSEGDDVTDPEKFSWSSDDEEVAKVDKKGNVEALKNGRAVITAKYKDKNGNEKEDYSTVKVVENPKDDKTTKLKDKDGNQVYYKKEDGSYEEAVFADYYTKSEFFVAGNVEYIYTGWQTLDGKKYYFDKNGNKVTGDQIIQGVSYHFGTDGVLNEGGNSGVMGIDVSKWNGAIDWTAVKNSGVNFVIIRCGYRGSASGVLVEDPRFKSNLAGAKAAGIKVGVYFFSQAVTEAEAVEEASMCLALIGGEHLDYPVFIDTEFTTGKNGRADGLKKAERTAVCRAFCETVKSGGYSTGVYSSVSWLGPMVDVSVLSGAKIWMAHYAAEPGYDGHYDIWQYSRKGSISGISGSVDMNLSYY